MPVSQVAQQAIQKSLDGVTSDPSTGLAGAVFVSVDKSGKILASHASGKKGLTSDKPLTMDSVFWIASCTKMITGVACMQLVEQGKLSLDDPDVVEKICPELKDVKVINDQLQLVPKEGRITLKMLLTHTAGFAYTFFNEKLRDWSRPVGIDEFSGDAKDCLELPLVYQPGKRFEYGVNIDWVGVMIERVSGMSLDAYFKKFIFEPLGIKNISFYPTDEMKSQLVHMHSRGADGRLAECDHLSRRSLTAETDHEKKHIFNSGGAGCFAKPVEFARILAVLLNDGTSPDTGARILSPQTVQSMFTNHIPDLPNFGRQPIPPAKPSHTNPIPDLYPQEGNPPQGWGLTFMITQEPGATGRGRNTGHWAGLSNLFWWADREKGVAGMIATQTLPFADLQVLGQWIACEKMVYDGLEEAAGQK